MLTPRQNPKRQTITDPSAPEKKKPGKRSYANPRYSVKRKRKTTKADREAEAAELAWEKQQRGERRKGA